MTTMLSALVRLGETPSLRQRLNGDRQGLAARLELDEAERLALSSGQPEAIRAAAGVSGAPGPKIVTAPTSGFGQAA